MNMWIPKLARHIEDRGGLMHKLLKKTDFGRKSFSLYIMLISSTAVVRDFGMLEFAV